MNIRSAYMSIISVDKGILTLSEGARELPLSLIFDLLQIIHNLVEGLLFLLLLLR